jgi:hypothetical protein
VSATSETPASSAPDLIARFLGRAAAAGGPSALLALTPEDRSESLVILQLQRQLARIANHPDGLTASADEVRAALHAAASEILAATRASRQLTPQSESKHPSSATPPSQMSVADSILGTPISPARDELAPVAAAAYAILAEAGGWNRESQQRLLQLAHTAGLTPQHIVTLAMNRPAIAAPASSAATPATTASSSRPQRSPISTDEPGAVRAEGPGDGTYIDESDPVRRFIKIGMVIGICAVITLVVGALSISALTRKTPPKPAVIAAATPEQKGDPRDKAAPVQHFPTRRIDASADKPEDKDKPRPAPTADSSAPDFTTALRSLHAAVDVLESDAPGAMQRFDAAVNTLSQTWTTVPADQLLASQDAVVEFIYRSAADPARGRATIRAIAAPLIAASGSPPPAESISPAAWSGGMIARLLRERELPAAALQEARAAFSHPLLALLSESDSTFAGGATAVLATLAHRIVPTHKTPPTAPVIPAWNAWTFAVDGLPAKDSVKNLLRIRALDAVLVEGAEVNKSKATYESIVLLASAINWRSGEESRLWLLRWVDSPDVSAPDLHALTSVLASRSAAEGLDITMVLSNTASGGDRAALRDRLREIWNLKNGPDRATLIADWERLVGNRIDADPAQISSLQHLTNAWNLSRLNEVAAQVWLGEPTELMLPDDSTLQGLASSPTRIAPHWNGESTWVVSYVAAGASISKRKELLNSFTPYGEPIAAEAEVIVNESIRGSPAEVRKLAQTLLNRWRSLPVFVNALLEAIPTMPATNETSSPESRMERYPLRATPHGASRLAAPWSSASSNSSPTMANSAASTASANSWASPTRAASRS